MACGIGGGGAQGSRQASNKEPTTGTAGRQGMTHEEDTLRGMEQALEEAHQELDRFRTEQQVQLADTMGAKVRAQMEFAGAEAREKALQLEAAQEYTQSVALQTLLISEESRCEAHERQRRRLVDELGDREAQMKNTQELQEELQMLQGKLQLSEVQASGFLRAENQVQSLQKKWLDARLQCQASEEELLKCQQLFEEEEQTARQLDAAKKRHMESAEETRKALDKLQTKSQRLELEATSQARRMVHEEDTLRGMEHALEEVHQELDRFRTEQQVQLADTMGAKVRAQMEFAGAEAREKALQVEAAQEYRQREGLRSLLLAEESRCDAQERRVRRLVDELGDREVQMRNVQELQEELHVLQSKLQLSEVQARGHLHAENQVQTLQKKLLDARVQCQASEEELLKCHQRFEEEEQALRQLEAAKKWHMESAEEAREALEKLQTKSQRLELEATFQARRMTHEEEALRGMEHVLEEVNQELGHLRSEQRVHLEMSQIRASPRASPTFQEEPLTFQTARARFEAPSAERSEQRLQKFPDELKSPTSEGKALEDRDQKVSTAAFEAKTMKLEASVARLRDSLESATAAQREEQEKVSHQELATRHFETALQRQIQRSEELCLENANLRAETQELEMRCRGHDEKSAQTLHGALSIEKQLLAVRAKHGHLQDAYQEQRSLRAREAEEGQRRRHVSESVVDALKEELFQLREEAAAERAVREEADHIQEEVEEKLKRLHSEELQGFHSEQKALRAALQLQRRNSTQALEAQRWALRREKQLRKQRYALLSAASEEMRGQLMRLKAATEEAAEADVAVEDQDDLVAEELERVKLDQQALSESRALENKTLTELEEVRQQLKDERRTPTPNAERITELVEVEQKLNDEMEQIEAAVAEHKRKYQEDHKKLEEAHAEERASRERAEQYHQQVAAETQLLAVDLLKLQGAFEADGESESNFSQSSKMKEGRALVEASSEEEGEEEAEEETFDSWEAH
ncbi:unnamed protein product [Durusdinium trenchii]|uniref:Uncharacterized protein n=1 Tax=Durusdinium trenchii TaxID=1381693 RepID=A0ABP0H589_9DINO